MSTKNFINPNQGLDLETRLDRLLGLLLSDMPVRPERVGDWPRVNIALFRGALFVIEATTPSFRAMLRFCPEKPKEGDYEIHYRPRGEVEKGHTVKIIPLPADEKTTWASMLASFTVRHAVFTVSDDRFRKELVWLVGLNNFRRVEEPENTDHGVA